MSQRRLKRIGDLEIDQHMPVQYFSWRLQATAQVLLVLFLAAALMGLFGGGPLARARAGDPARLEVEYGRFERRTQEITLALRVATPHTETPGVTTVDLWIAGSTLEAAPLVRVVPEPERVALESGRVVFTLRLGGDRPQVRLTLKPEVFGTLRAQLGLVGGPALAFGVFVYP